MRKSIYVSLSLLLLAGLLAACTPGNPITVVFESDGQIIGQEEVTPFEHALVPDLNAQLKQAEGMRFAGWSYTPIDAESAATLDKPADFDSGSVLVYKELLPHMEDDLVVLHPQWLPLEAKQTSDLVIGWYAKTDTSGLDQDRIDKVEAAFTADFAKAFPDKSYIFRAYDGDVATIGTKINADADVDILLGVGGNITSKGGVETIEMVKDIEMGGKARVIALVTDDAYSRFALDWFTGDKALALFAE